LKIAPRSFWENFPKPQEDLKLLEELSYPYKGKKVSSGKFSWGKFLGAG